MPIGQQRLALPSVYIDPARDRPELTKSLSLTLSLLALVPGRKDCIDDCQLVFDCIVVVLGVLGVEVLGCLLGDRGTGLGVGLKGSLVRR